MLDLKSLVGTGYPEELCENGVKQTTLFCGAPADSWGGKKGGVLESKFQDFIFKTSQHSCSLMLGDFCGHKNCLGGGFKHVLCSSPFREDSYFEYF